MKRFILIVIVVLSGVSTWGQNYKINNVNADDAVVGYVEEIVANNIQKADSHQYEFKLMQDGDVFSFEYNVSPDGINGVAKTNDVWGELEATVLKALGDIKKQISKSSVVEQKATQPEQKQSVQQQSQKQSEHKTEPSQPTLSQYQSQPVQQQSQQQPAQPQSQQQPAQQFSVPKNTNPRNSNVLIQDQVGCLKKFDDGTYGIIFIINQNGQGLAVSLDETVISWENQTKSSNCHDVSLLFNEEDCNLAFVCGIGKGYSESIVRDLGMGAAPAAGWCMQHGNGWYLPSAGELWKLLIVANKKMGWQGPISQALYNAGGQALSDGKYWTSNEKNKKEAYWVSTNGDNDEEDKTKAINVRAIRAF